MGANSSKSSGLHSWTGSSAPSLSQELVESLQSSNETDASRARTIELHVQARVADELKKLQKKESDALQAVYDKISAATESEKEGGSGDEPSSRAVSAEVETLRRKLQDRRQIKQLPEGVESARSDVVRCLREHDRRPLECYKEVEAFKAEVRKLESGWVDRVTS